MSLSGLKTSTESSSAVDRVGAAEITHLGMDFSSPLLSKGLVALGTKVLLKGLLS